MQSSVIGPGMVLDMDLQRPAESIVAVATDEIEGPLLVRTPQRRVDPRRVPGLPAHFQVAEGGQPADESIRGADAGAKVQAGAPVEKVVSAVAEQGEIAGQRIVLVVGSVPQESRFRADLGAGRREDREQTTPQV